MKTNKLDRLSVKVIDGSTWARFTRAKYGMIRKLDDRRASMLNTAIDRMLMLGQIRLSSVDMQVLGQMSVIFVFPVPDVPVSSVSTESGIDIPIYIDEESHSEWVRGLNVPTQEEVNEFLDKLRASAVTNMFEAVPFIMKEFEAVTEKEAENFLISWMDSFSPLP